MKIAAFFLYLFFHLLGGGNVVYAASRDNDASSTLEFEGAIKDQLKYVQSVPNTVLITIAEFDLEEELSTSDSFKSTSTTITDGKIYLAHAWYLNFSCQSVSNHYFKNFKIFAPSCGQSNPIYILQRVLRI